jgi:imidazolonepropionase-like amidohydrolase
MNICLKNGLVFDGHHPSLIADHVIGVSNGRIAHFSKDPWEKRPDHEIDLRGRVLMPGFMDAHYHAYAGLNNHVQIEALPATYLAHHARNALQGSLRRGFTSVRDAAGADYGLWRAIEERLFEAPRLFFGDKALSQTGGHSDVRPAYAGGDLCGCCLAPGILGQVVDGVEGVRKAAREIMRRGAHHVKIMASGGLSSPTDPVWMTQYTEEEMQAAVEEAARWRGYVMAHAYGADTVARAVKCGVRSIEHGNLIDAPTARLIADAGAFVVPTLTTYDDLQGNVEEIGEAATEVGGLKELLRKGMEMIETCTAAGVKLGFGTDLFAPMLEYELQEFRLRGEVSTPFEVLHSATAVNAELVQRKDDLGCVKDGAVADLIVVEGNPLEDLSVLWNKPNPIWLVMKEGRIVGTASGQAVGCTQSSFT